MIFIQEEQQVFHLQNKYFSYIFRVMEETGILEQLYVGSPIPELEDYELFIEREIRPGNNLVEGSLLTSLETIKQEMPVFGTTDFRYPAIDLESEAGDHVFQFTYQGYSIRDGKEVLEGLPGSFADAPDAQVLTIHLKDRYEELYLDLRYTVFQDLAVLTRQQQIRNQSGQNFNLHQLASLSLDLSNENYEWLHLDGAWAKEAHLKRDKIHTGVQQISSTRGASSHMHNPFLAVCEPTTTETRGQAFGFCLLYSGNFLAQIERDNFDVLRIQLGINPFQFKWKLEDGESFDSPEAVMVYRQDGLNAMSQTFHQFFQKHLVRSSWRDTKRPVLLNNWEATYFDFDEEKLLEIAREAKNLGVELLVLDDGWFGDRNRDEGSLGNWVVNRKKLPGGLEKLSKTLHDEGLLFGLWFEPEMVSKDTPLYQEHPDWIIGQGQKNISHGRNQYILDFGNPQVVEEIFGQMDQILSQVEIDYIKLDMNRYISEAFSNHLPADRQGEVCHRYILGVYRLYEKLIQKYPHILIESCAGGGARFDGGMLYYSPQIWASDDTDAIERIQIQSGLSMLYPLATMGSHVSAVPNHQVARITSLEMRKNVALFGSFGYELDPTKLEPEEKEQIKLDIKEYQSYQNLIYTGNFYRLETGDSNRKAWMVVSQDQKEALVAHYQILAEPNPNYKRLKLQGLLADGKYHVSEKRVDQVRTGADLEAIGLLLNQNYIGRQNDFWSREMPGDFHSRLFYLKMIE